MPRTLPGRISQRIDCESQDPRTVERRVYLSCPAHDVNFFAPSTNSCRQGPRKKPTSINLMRLQGQTSKTKPSSCLPRQNLTRHAPVTSRYGFAGVSLGNACPIETSGTRSNWTPLGSEDISCQRRAFTARTRVVRVSRLIGKFDSTGSSETPQVVAMPTPAVRP